MSVQQEKFKKIADAIREKTGTTDLIKPSAFAEKVNEVYDKGRTDENTEIANAFRDTTFAPNLFDKDNYEHYHSWGVDLNSIKPTDTGLQWTNLRYSSSGGGGYLTLKFGLAKDYAGKILTLQTKQFYNGYTGLGLKRADGTDIIEGYTQFNIQQKNGAYIDRIQLADSGYTDEIIVIRFYYGVIETVVFDEIMVHDHYDAIQPYVPYGYKPTINAQDYSTEISNLYNKGINDHIIETNRLVQAYGSRTNYEYAYYSNRDYGYWTPRTFYPQYDIRGTSFNRAFNSFGANIYANSSLDLSTRLEECGVVLDTSEATTLAMCFGNSTIERVPTLDCRNCDDTNGLTTVFGYCEMETVDKMIVKRTQMFPSTFTNTHSLKNITFEGEIGQNISFASCPLTVESMKSVISHLVDYKGTENEGTHTLTLSDECKTALKADTETVEFNGQTYTYFELITAKGWNLA